MKRIVSALLLTMLIITIFASVQVSAQNIEEKSAQKLFDLGLFKGMGMDDGTVDFALEDNLTREQAVVMLLRLLGKEEEAFACNFPCSYPDVAVWAVPYVGYAQITGLTLGIGEGLFGGGDNVSGKQFLTFVLRALGYCTPIDFAWDKAGEFAASVGLESSEYASKDVLTRGNAVVICERALSLKTEGGVTLLEYIKNAATVDTTPDSYDRPVFSSKGGSTETTGSVNINNEDRMAITASGAMKQPSSLNIKGDGSVQVIVVHTHATEAYTQSDGLTYKKTSNFRTVNTQRNMVRIGEIVTDILNSRGIGTIHITALNDHPNYNNSYKRTRALVEEALLKYPNVQMVIDLHRDSYHTSTDIYKTGANINGRDAAQLMIVSGTGGNSNWKENLGIQTRIHNFVENRYPGLMRSILLRDSSYNHDLTPGSMIVEVGTDGNSLSEAMYSAYLFADSLADYLLDE